MSSGKEESMVNGKRKQLTILTGAVFALIALSCCSSPAPAIRHEQQPVFAPAPKKEPTLKGTVVKTDKGTAIIHTYISPDLEEDPVASHIIETKHALIIIDTQLSPNAARELKAYTDFLEKPIALLVVTGSEPECWAGSAAFDSVPITTTKTIYEAVSYRPGMNAEESVRFAAESEEVDGLTILFDVVKGCSAIEHIVMRIPDIETLVMQNLLVNRGHMFTGGKNWDSWKAKLGEYERLSGYGTVLPGRGLPGDMNLFATNRMYLEASKAAYDKAETGAEYEQLLTAAFPGYGAVPLLEKSIRALFPKPLPSQPPPEPEKKLPLRINRDTSRIVIRNTNLYPAAIDYDQRTRRFLLGSASQGIITAVETVGEFYYPYNDDPYLEGTRGLKIDQKANRLYVINTSPASAKNRIPRNSGELFIYNLATGKRQSNTDLFRGTPSENHLASSLALDDRGNLYITDSRSPIILKMDAEHAPKVFAQGKNPDAGGFEGIVYDKNGFLVAARPGTGELYRIPLDSPADMSTIETEYPTPGASGVLWDDKGRLLIISHEHGKPSIIYCFSSGDGWKTAQLSYAVSTKYEAHTGVLANGSVYVLASFLGNFETEKTTDTFYIVKVEP